MIPPMPSYVNIWHNDTYPAINPSRPALSHEGKTIVITGSSDGIGKGIANAYAAAGAAKVVILARREALLVKVKDDIESKYPKTKVSYHVADVIDKDSLDKAAKETGEWHVLVLNAGFQSEHSHPMATADAQDWWKGFEVNIFGAFLSIQAFMPTRASKAAVVGISSGVVSMPGSAMLNSTSYQSSKMGLAKVLETFAAENLDMHVGIIHPGVVATDMLEKSEMGDSLPIDTVELPANFIVWSTSPEGAFTSGKFVWANWDVEELQAMTKEIREPGTLTTNVMGWPWASRGQAVM